GFASTLGRLAGAGSLDEVVAHAAALDCATDLPVSVDLGNGLVVRPPGDRIGDGSGGRFCIEKAEPTTGFEPATRCLQIRI
ncbi:MAG: hypothetical protein M3256_04215, partial [Actinomycetota bacterium]|nr:hypothetical protein [Actinomycetota bacterium]